MWNWKRRKEKEKKGQPSLFGLESSSSSSSFNFSRKQSLQYHIKITRHIPTACDVQRSRQLAQAFVLVIDLGGVASRRCRRNVAGSTLIGQQLPRPFTEGKTRTTATVAAVQLVNLSAVRALLNQQRHVTGKSELQQIQHTLNKFSSFKLRLFIFCT